MYEIIIYSICTKHRIQLQCRFNAVDLLAKLSVDGQDLRVAHESKGQNGDGVCGLWNRQCFLVHSDVLV